jgi:superfamily II DNA or RNA helicase
LEVIRRWIKSNKPALVFVPTQVLAEQWRAEIAAELTEENPGVLDAGAGFGRATWESEVSDYTRNMGELGPRIVVSTMQTGSTTQFLKRVQQGDHLLLVADEVHRVGSPQQRGILALSAGGRLGLSATPERYGDPEGTAGIKGYFGPILKPEFTIGDAIAAGRLVPYDYFIHRVALTQEEIGRWDVLSEQIRQEFARLPRSTDGERAFSERFKLLLIQRARILKQASSKVSASIEILANEYKDGDRWLLYCDDLNQLRALGNACRGRAFPTYEYHSAMDGARPETLEAFQRRGGVLVAIRCLDEGVDLPSLNRALILASSSNPREFIQRRGRVLRSAPGKFSAAVHDLLVVPPPQSASGGIDRRSMLRTEISRARQFAAYCRNTATSMELQMLSTELGLPEGDDAGSFESEEDSDG